ncbi:MAG: UDP-N-acetylmuramate--L-alanine ligase [Nitrospiria bacterium]
MFRKIQHIHFVGIGGSGMSGIAEVLLNLGYRVTGSDLFYSETVKHLENLGGKIYVGHEASHVEGAQVVVVSSAVSSENVEIQAARANLIPVIPRAEMLAELMRLKYGIAVAGAHGKTTTTSMIATVLAHGGLDPTVVIGGKLNQFGSNAKLGQGEFLVAEADESDGSFLKLSPTIAVLTNIDREHLDYYGDIERIKTAFSQFVNKVPFYGAVVLCLDQPHIQEILPRIEKRYVTYGMTGQADLMAREEGFRGWLTRFSVHLKGRDLGLFEINVPGIHNVYNALAAIAVGLELDQEVEKIRQALYEFRGVERRFQLRGEKRGILVVDDYGHHPTEIKATLAAARMGWKGRLIVLFQPHRYTRTRDLMDDFATSFYQADVLFLTEIYSAGEKPIEGVSSAHLFERLKTHGHREVVYTPHREDMMRQVLSTLRSGDLVMTLGAGDIWKMGKELIEKL